MADSRETEITHVVQSGEYLTKIASRYGVTIDDLMRWNNLPKDARLDVGDKLVIKGKQKDQNGGAAQAALAETKTGAKADAKSNGAGQPKGAKKITHKVAPGECPGSIAEKYGVPTRDFLAWNNLTQKSVLNIGAQTVVYVPDKDAEAKPAAAPDKKDVVAKAPVKDSKEKSKEAKGETKKDKTQKLAHTVVAGDNPSSIAQKYKVDLNDLLQWNGWKKNTVLQVGQKVMIVKK